MDTRNFCQSCSMPLDTDEMKGTEKDSSKSNEYCKYCYQQGSFVSPGMTMKEMEEIVKTQMEKMKMPDTLIQQAVQLLPSLKRWRKKETVL